VNRLKALRVYVGGVCSTGRGCGDQAGSTTPAETDGPTTVIALRRQRARKHCVIFWAIINIALLCYSLFWWKLWNLRDFFKHRRVQYNTIQYNTIQYNTIQYMERDYTELSRAAKKTW